MLLLGLAHRLVPPAQVEPLRAAVRRFLSASHLDGWTSRRRIGDFESLREAGEAHARAVGDAAAVCQRARRRASRGEAAPLRRLLRRRRGAVAFRSAKPSAPVFLLHGVDDNVIPAVESEYLAEELRGRAPVRFWSAASSPAPRPIGRWAQATS